MWILLFFLFSTVFAVIGCIGFAVCPSFDQLVWLDRNFIIVYWMESMILECSAAVLVLDYSVAFELLPVINGNNVLDDDFRWDHNTFKCHLVNIQCTLWYRLKSLIFFCSSSILLINMRFMKWDSFFAWRSMSRVWFMQIFHSEYFCVKANRSDLESYSFGFFQSSRKPVW